VSGVLPAAQSDRLSDARPSFGSGPFAGHGSLLVERASANGSWIVVCQARTERRGNGQLNIGQRQEPPGDLLDRYLLAPGEELSIDGLLGTDASERYALVVRGEKTWLWDSEGNETRALTAIGGNERLSAESFAELRTLSFDPSSEHLMYAGSAEQGERLVIRTLGAGTERKLDPGAGLIWRAHFDPGGVYAVVELIGEDTNRNGKADFPAPLLAAPRPCRASPEHFHAWPVRGDRPEVVLIPLSGGAAIHEPDLVMPVSDALLLRDASGALLLERAGKKRMLEPAACQGRIVHADAKRELFIVGCTQKKAMPGGTRGKDTGRVSLELVSPQGRQSLNLELASVELDREVSDSARLVALYPGSETVLFDADRREVLALRSGDVVLATRAGRALIRRGDALLFYDVDTHGELALPATLEKYPNILLTPPFAFVSPVLINLDTASVVGSSPLRPLALSSEGKLLVADGAADSSRLARGPLRWITLGS
jgi:hypothetical protein